MTKFALAVLAAVALTSINPLPSLAQTITHVPPRGDQPNNPNTPSSPAAPETCGSELGYLKRVYPVQVAGIKQGARVWVTEICNGFSMLRSEGNAEYLRPTIAKNKVLTTALFSKDYSAEDVFAVRVMGEGTINLYVHRFTR